MYQLLHDILPEVAMAETRSISLAKANYFDLPGATYSFLEMFCNEADCDCRRVIGHYRLFRKEILKQQI